jgi:sulfonate transport system ATP-binding protein
MKSTAMSEEGATLGANAPIRGTATTLRGVKKSFGTNDVLRGLNLHVAAGQFVAIVGRSGCGKSTLLRLIAGLDEPNQGYISYDDGAIPSAREVARVMFQEPRLLPWINVIGNVEIGLGAYRRAQDSAAKAHSVLQAMGLDTRADDWPDDLSGGQRQRVAFARALVSRPRLLAFDEPLGALDALTRIEMQHLLEKTWLAEGFTALLVTHDVSEAITLADRIILIEEGTVAGDIEIALPRPRRRDTVEFAELEGRILDHLLRGDSSGWTI